MSDNDAARFLSRFAPVGGGNDDVVVVIDDGTDPAARLLSRFASVGGSNDDVVVVIDDGTDPAMQLADHLLIRDGLRVFRGVLGKFETASGVPDIVTGKMLSAFGRVFNEDLALSLLNRIPHEFQRTPFAMASLLLDMAVLHTETMEQTNYAAVLRQTGPEAKQFKQFLDELKIYFTHCVIASKGIGLSLRHFPLDEQIKELDSAIASFKKRSAGDRAQGLTSLAPASPTTPAITIRRRDPEAGGTPPSN